MFSAKMSNSKPLVGFVWCDGEVWQLELRLPHAVRDAILQELKEGAQLVLNPVHLQRVCFCHEPNDDTPCSIYLNLEEDEEDDGASTT